MLTGVVVILIVSPVIIISSSVAQDIGDDIPPHVQRVVVIFCSVQIFVLRGVFVLAPQGFIISVQVAEAEQ